MNVKVWRVPLSLHRTHTRRSVCAVRCERSKCIFIPHENMLHKILSIFIRQQFCFVLYLFRSPFFSPYWCVCTLINWANEFHSNKKHTQEKNRRKKNTVQHKRLFLLLTFCSSCSAIQFGWKLDAIAESGRESEINGFDRAENPIGS